MQSYIIKHTHIFEISPQAILMSVCVCVCAHARVYVCVCVCVLFCVALHCVVFCCLCVFCFFALYWAICSNLEKQHVKEYIIMK